MRSGLASRSSIRRTVGACGQAAISATLCALLAGLPVLAEAPATTRKPAAAENAGQIQGTERVLHALNRMTFGPRPGDVAAVEKMGVNKWFEMQLNPGRIDDSALDARLAEYPATLMRLDALESKYPSPGELRQMMTGRLALPADPTERALVQDQIAFYAMAQENKGKISEAQAQAGINGQATNMKKAGAQAAPGQAADGAAMNGAPVDASATPAQSATQTAAQSAAAARRARRAQIAAGQNAMNEASPDGSTMSPGDKPVSPAEMAADPITGQNVPAAAKVPQAEVQRVLALAPEQRMQALLTMPPRELVRFRASLTGDEATELGNGLTPTQRETLVALAGSQRMVGLEAMESRLDRDIYSNRQLEAVMTDFWLNHFNVYAAKSQVEPYLLPSYERDTIRPHALGKFEDLLVATAESPAMLVYLDNFKSDGPDSARSVRVKQAQQRFSTNPKLKQVATGLNENYGRELMELHTLGVNGGGYTQADVTNVSKVFTGWTLNKPYAGSAFTFDPSRHEPGSKVVLGKTIQYRPGADGVQEGLEVLHMLATSPATARFISTKLAVRFVSDDPPAALVDRMAAAFLKSDGDMKVVLRTMFDSPEFWSPAVYRAKVKTPLEFVVSAARASDLQVTKTQALVQSLGKLGMPLYGMQTPNGYGWKQADWVSTGALVSRLNFSLVLSDDRIPGTRTEWTTLLGETGVGTAGVKPASFSPGTTEDAAAKEKRLELILLGAPVSERTRATVLSQSTDQDVAAQAEAQFDLSNKGGGKLARYQGKGADKEQKRLDRVGRGPEDPQAAVMAGLLLGSPDFQRR